MEENQKSSNPKSKVPRAKEVSQSKDEVHYHYYMDDQKPGGAPGPAPAPAPDRHYHYYYEPPSQFKRKSSKPTIAGVLLIIAAVLGLITGVGAMAMGAMFSDMDEGFAFFGEDTKGDISGRVTYLNGTPVENVNISIIGEPLSTQTDPDGNYQINNVPTGNQKIRVEKEGYNTIIYKAYISPDNFEGNFGEGRNDEGDDNEFDFTLTEGNEEIEDGEYPPWDFIANIMIACAALIIIFSIFAIIGGIYALKRKKFGVAVLGAVLGLFTILGTIFALIAVLILALSRKEFNGDLA